MDDFKPPKHLSPRAAALWASVVPSRAKSPGRLALIQAALEALDLADAARLAVAEHGMVSVTKTTGAVHVHPLVKVERDARAQFTSIWLALKLSWDQSIDGGPSMSTGSILRQLSRLPAEPADEAPIDDDDDLGDPDNETMRGATGPARPATGGLAILSH